MNSTFNKLHVRRTAKCTVMKPLISLAHRLNVHLFQASTNENNERCADVRLMMLSQQLHDELLSFLAHFMTLQMTCCTFI